MSDPYKTARRDLKARVLERVADGTPVIALCAEPGMPCDTTIRNWRRTDPVFAEAMQAALRRGQWRRKVMYDEARAQAFLARYRSGEPIRSILRDPAMPSRLIYNRWLSQPPFAEEVHRLKAVHEYSRLRGLRSRRRDWDPGLADRVLAKVCRGAAVKDLRADDPSMPSLKVLNRWRREQPEFDAAMRVAIRAAGPYGKRMRGRYGRLKQVIVDRLREGASLHSLGKEPGMPCAETLYRWVRQRPDFRDAVALACDDREDWYHDRILAIAETVTPGTVTATRKRMSPLVRQLGRLKHRPGRKWR
jgi:transposase-like protein